MDSQNSKQHHLIGFVTKDGQYYNLTVHAKGTKFGNNHYMLFSKETREKIRGVQVCYESFEKCRDEMIKLSEGRIFITVEKFKELYGN